MGASNAKGRRCYVTNFDDLSVTVEASDIEIGAIELKNAANDDRALIAAAGGTPTFALATMPVVANAAAPTLSEAKANYISSDLSGRVRTVERGATNLATSQVTSTGTAATLSVARATRRSVLFTNTHSSGSVWIGPATVTSSNGQKLGPGQACPFTWVGLYQVIDDGATHCVVCVADEYD